MKFNNVKFVRNVAIACTTVAMLLVGCNEPDVITPTPEPEPEPTPDLRDEGWCKHLNRNL